MSIAGPEDEQNGDRVEGIHYFDFTDPLRPGEPSTEADPFADENRPEPRDAGAASGAPRRHLAADEPAPEPVDELADEPPDELPPIDPFEYALIEPSHRRAPRPKATTPEPTRAEPPAEPPSHVEFFPLASLFEPSEAGTGARARFASAFNTARAEHGAPFLAVAVQMPAASPASVHFPIVAEGIRAVLGGGDVLLADEERLRLAAVLRGRRAEDARALFAQLKDYLRAWIADADDALRAISALVAPDGRPFHDAEEFLARAYDEG